MEMVDILYVGETKFKQSVFGQKVVKGKKMTTVTEHTVLKGPAKKRIRQWDSDEQRYRIFEINYLQEGDKFYARNVQGHLAKRICDSSPNFKVVQRNGHAAPAKISPESVILEDRLFVKLTQKLKIGKKEFDVGEKKNFVRSFAERLIANGKAVLESQEQ